MVRNPKNAPAITQIVLSMRVEKLTRLIMSKS